MVVPRPRLGRKEPNILIIGADYGTTSTSEFDPSRQCLVGITINAPVAEQNHREYPCVSTHSEKPRTDQLDMATTVVAQKNSERSWPRSKPSEKNPRRQPPGNELLELLHLPILRARAARPHAILERNVWLFSH